MSWSFHDLLFVLGDMSLGLLEDRGCPLNVFCSMPKAVLNNVLVPNIFPSALYQKLLHDLQSPCAKRLGLDDFASVCKDQDLHDVECARWLQ